ncbi:MAG TPA: class I adenylate-forming enzyme family protein [Burkholderiales bacterium]
MTLLAHWITRQAALRASAPALALDGVILNFGELRDLGRRLGAGYASRGVQPGQAVALVSVSSRELIRAALGASFAGAAFFPLDARLPAPRRADLLLAVAPEYVLAGEDHRLAPAAGGSEAPAPHPTPDAAELLIATSGSGGAPRAAVLTARNLEAAAVAAAARVPLAPGESWIGCLPLFHVGGMSLPYRCARAGACLRLHQDFDPERVLGELDSGTATHVSLVPAMLAALLDEADGRPLPPGVKCLLVGGAPLGAALAKRALAAGWPVFVTYGMTEAASQVATGRLDAAWRPGWAGPPLPGMTVDIMDDGRIRVRGEAVMAGYGGEGRRPAQPLEGGVFVTSDLGRLEADGSLVVLGRADEVLLSGGENVHPEEVEPLLAQCPGVEDAALTARPDPAWGDRLVALVVGSADPAAVERWCRERLPPPWRPRAILKVPALPRTALSKLDRPGLRRLAAELSRGETG